MSWSSVPRISSYEDMPYVEMTDLRISPSPAPSSGRSSPPLKPILVSPLRDRVSNTTPSLGRRNVRPISPLPQIIGSQTAPQQTEAAPQHQNTPYTPAVVSTYEAYLIRF